LATSSWNSLRPSTTVSVTAALASTNCPANFVPASLRSPLDFTPVSETVTLPSRVARRASCTLEV